MTTLSYNQIIKLSRDFATADYRLKGHFGNGPLSDEVLHNQISTFKYWLMWMEDLPMPLEKNVEVFGFRIAFISQVPTLKERGTDLMSTNENDVISDALQIAKDYLSFWEMDTNYPTLKVDLNVQRNVIRNATPDEVWGCYIEIRFRQAIVYDACVLPMSGTTPPENSCPGVFIYIDDVFQEEAPSGTNYFFTSGGGSTPVDVTVNGVVVFDEVTTDQTLSVQNSAADEKGSLTAPGVWTVGDSTVNVKDSAGNTLYAKSVAAASIDDQVVTDVTQTINSVPITNNKAQTSKAITIRYANNDPVVVTPITDTETVFVGEVPDVVTQFPSSKIWKTGQTTAYGASGKDDGSLERGNGASFTTLNKNNYFGNTNRFTDILGGQTYTNNWVIDWSTWDKETGEFVMWYRVKQSIAAWETIMTNQPYTIGSYNDCYVPHRRELPSLINSELIDGMNYSPINISVSGGGTDQLYTSTTVPSNTAAAYAWFGQASNGAVGGKSKVSNGAYILLRVGSVSEL
jgi:hypothetical protein